LNYIRINTKLELTKKSQQLQIDLLNLYDNHVTKLKLHQMIDILEYRTFAQTFRKLISKIIADFIYLKAYKILFKLNTDRRKLKKIEEKDRRKFNS